LFNFTHEEFQFKPQISAHFSLWSLVLDLCNLTLNWLINFQFLQFDPWFVNSIPLYTRLFKFDPWFWISSIKSLIGHQTSIFMQWSPWFDQINSQKL
jgi:hypothetical protein